MDLAWGESLWEVLKTKVGTYISFAKVFCTVKLKWICFIFSHRQEANMFSYVFCCSLHWFILFEVIFQYCDIRSTAPLTSWKLNEIRVLSAPQLSMCAYAYCRCPAVTTIDSRLLGCLLCCIVVFVTFCPHEPMDNLSSRAQYIFRDIPIYKLSIGYHILLTTGCS
jgi:hypothetical protein